MTAQTAVCPYFNRLGNEVRYPIIGYCERSSVCALRVPSLGEFKRFCTTGDFRHCPIYRLGPSAETGQESKAGPDKLEMA
jgi:hypothetical protein